MAWLLTPLRQWPGPLRRWRLWVAVLLPLLVVVVVQTFSQSPAEHPEVTLLREGHAQFNDALAPPADLDQSRLRTLPVHRRPTESGAMWLAFTLPPSTGDTQLLVLSYRPGLTAYLDGALLARSDSEAQPSARLVLGHRRMSISLSPALRSEGQSRQLQLRLHAPGPSGASLDAPMLGPPDIVRALDDGRRHWQWLRSVTAIAGVLVAVFLGLVARVRREEPLYALSSAHVALLALLLSPYALSFQPLPSPFWRMVLDAADLVAKLLLVMITAHLAEAWTPRLRKALWVIASIGLPFDALAGALGWSWSSFSQPWPWWALGSRAALLGIAWAYALKALMRSHHGAAWGTALLVGFSTLTWAWVSFGVLALHVAVIDSNALAHAGWVAWVGMLLQRHFLQAARRDAALRAELARELAARSHALEAAYEAHAEAERRQAAADQRRRLLQDLHDGLGARLLHLRLGAPQMNSQQLGQAIDDCLLEMRLSVDALAENEGELGVLLGGWRQRVEGLVAAAGVQMVWQVHHDPALSCLRGGGGLELVRWLQEALSNTLRHAHARTLWVATEATPDGVSLWFVDDGCGVGSASVGQGRRNLRDRATRLGAEFSVHSPAPRRWVGEGMGTALELRLRA